MARDCTACCTNIGKKFWVALTGFAISFFVLIHMSENLILFKGGEAYNRYTHWLTSNPLLPLAEILLLLAFVVHIVLAASLTWENWRAKPVGASLRPSNPDKAARFGSRYMILSGLLLLVFLILHVLTFRFGTIYSVNYGGVEMRDLYRLVAEKFQSPGFLAWYLFSLIILFWHLSHGASSLFQSVGLLSVRNPVLKSLGFLFAFVVAAGFFTEPILMFVRGH